MKQIPILAGKREDIKPEKTDISPTLCGGALQNTTNQERAYVMVIEDDETESKEQHEKRLCRDRCGGVLDLTAPGSKTRRGRVQDEGKVTPTLDTGCDVGVVEQIGQIYGTENEPNPQAGRVYSDKGISPTLDCMEGGNRMPKVMGDKLPRIRKLTPKECFRLQGFPDEYFERANLVNSDSQLYKQSGNAVTVNVIYEIARRAK